MFFKSIDLSAKSLARSLVQSQKSTLNNRSCQLVLSQNKSTQKTAVRTDKPTLTQTVISEMSTEAPEGVRPEFYSSYYTTFSKISKPWYEKEVIKHSELNNILLKVETKEELSLMPSLIEHWRRRQLPSAGFVTRFTLWKVEELETPEVGFNLLADRHSYGLFPLTREFNRVLSSFSKHLNTLQSNEQLDEEKCKELLEKMMMTYALIYQYEQVPTPETYQIIINSILNSPLKEAWFGRVHQLVTEAKYHKLSLDPVLLTTLKPLYEELRPQASNAI
jgi:hypothetical protein